MSGLSRLQQGAALRLLPPSNDLQEAKVPAQEQDIKLDSSVLVRLEQRQERVLQLAGGQVIALAMVLDHELPSPPPTAFTSSGTTSPRTASSR